jgi:hypothetical protein
MSTGEPSTDSVRRRFLRYWFLPETVSRAVRVAVVVAPVLIAINHADAILRGDLTIRLALKMLLTFLVPYAVSSYSSAKALIQSESSPTG